MKTAVELLIEQAKDFKFFNYEDAFNFTKLLYQAKEMEKEQIMQAFEAAEKDCGKDFLHGDLYYNETFKSE
jgi:hypothetical protein